MDRCDSTSHRKTDQALARIAAHVGVAALTATTAVASFAPINWAAAQSRPPNIVLIVADDIHYCP